MDCVAYVSYFEGKLKVDIITVENAIVLFTNLTYTNGKAFINALPSFTHYKAMILHIYDNQSHGYSNNFEFCEAVRNELQKLKIKYMFVARAYFFMSSFFVAANFTDINIGDTNLNRASEVIRKEILLSTNPNKIIFCVSPSPLVEPLKKILKPNFCFDLVEKILDMAYETVVELYKRMIDKSDVKRFIVPTSPRRYGFGYKIGEKSYHYINVSESDPLPICKIFTVRRLSYEMVYHL
uniref:Uncharacterized protein n=1 Tax=Panagrolaimus sp. ES5 TaxID=591445 RepID=A0AC34FIP4_9BILA